MINADKGLIAFRRGEHEMGRLYYGELLKLLQTTNCRNWKRWLLLTMQGKK